MKRAFVICAALATFIMSWGLLFKLCLWNGGTILLLLGLLMTIIAGSMALVCASQGQFGNKGLGITVSISVILAALGVAFTVSHWPGGHIFSLIALGVLLPVCAIWYALYSFKKG